MTGAKSRLEKCVCVGRTHKSSHVSLSPFQNCRHRRGQVEDVMFHANYDDGDADYDYDYDGDDTVIPCAIF